MLVLAACGERTELVESDEPSADSTTIGLEPVSAPSTYPATTRPDSPPGPATLATPVVDATIAGEQRYSVTELQGGVDVAIGGMAQAVDAATVLFPDSLPSFISLTPELEERGVAIMKPGDHGFDAVVVYRTGPYCGLLPTVAVNGDTSELTISIASRGAEGCDDKEYDEAVGLDLAPDYEAASIVGRHTAANPGP
jgi:hypothetical protein